MKTEIREKKSSRAFTAIPSAVDMMHYFIEHFGEEEVKKALEKKLNGKVE